MLISSLLVLFSYFSSIFFHFQFSPPPRPFEACRSRLSQLCENRSVYMFLCACKTIQVIPFYRIYFSTRPPFSVNLKAAPFLPPLPNIYNECSLIPSSIVYIPDSFYPYSSICLTQFYKYFAIHGISWPIHHIVIIHFTSVFSTTSSRP